MAIEVALGKALKNHTVVPDMAAETALEVWDV